MRICVILNPAARGEKAKLLRASLPNLDGQCALKLTHGPGTGRILAAEAVREGFETIGAAGGDGTVNEVLNGIGDIPDGFERARLGVLPAGTVNVFAREIGLPMEVRAAWKAVIGGREISIDLPQVEFVSQGRNECRHFIQMAGAGWDARAAEAVDWNLKKRIGQYAYMVAGLKTLADKMPLITVTEGTKTFQGQLVIVGNGRFYGGPIPVFHQANNRDGLLDICVFPKINLFVLLRYVLGYLSPHLFKRGSEIHFQSASFQLESKPPARLQLDGETIGDLPASCAVRRQALRVVVP